MFKVIDMKRSTATTYYCSFADMMQLHESQSTERPRLKVSVPEFKSACNFAVSVVIAKITEIRAIN